MKPTQQEIIELARKHATRYTNRHYPEQTVFTFTQDKLEEFANLLLERFGAGVGGGEPVATLYGTLPVYDTPQPAKQGGQETKIIQFARDTGVTDTREYGEPIPIECLERFAALIRAAALEDAARVCDEVSLQANAAWKLAYRPQDQGREMGADECADAIRALKGKQ